MVIAINTRVLSGNSSIAALLVACFEIIATNQPDHDFVFISEKDITAKTSPLKNIKRIVLPQQSNNPLLWKLWYNYKLPALLKKIRADVLISGDGVGLLRTRTPQCLLITDLSFLQHPDWFKKKYHQFIKTNTPAFLQKANRILTLSNGLKNELHQQYNIDEKKVSVVYAGADPKYLPLDQEAKEAVKERYTEGREYFLFSGIIHPGGSLVNLLKAFSLFKKRQKSNMQLIIASGAPSADKVFVESLPSYKYRNEVQLLENLDEDLLRKVTASAYACINVSPLHTEIISLLNVIRCQVPVVAGHLHIAIELLGEAALYANGSVPEDIAEKMMLLYKDETKRSDLIQEGIKRSAKFDLDGTAAHLWENTLLTIQQG